MDLRPRHLLIRWVLPLTWRANPAQRTRVLQEFAQTELDSAWQSLYALERIQDQDLRALLFRHASEELFHADLFRRLAYRNAETLPDVPLTRREPLLELTEGDRKSAVEFFAYLAIGENEIRTDFSAYEAAIPDPEVRQLFSAIRADEDSHAEDSGAALASLVNGRGRSLAWIRLRHLGQLAWRRYISLGNKIGTVPMTLLLGTAYFLFGGLFRGQARERIGRNPAAQLTLIRHQQSELDRSLGIAP